jgi:hypothetical protein
MRAQGITHFSGCKLIDEIFNLVDLMDTKFYTAGTYARETHDQRIFIAINPPFWQGITVKLTGVTSDLA